MNTTRAIVFVATLVGTLGCGEEKDDPCPQIAAGGAKIAPVLTTGTAPTPSGGALVAGTFNLSKLEVVLSASASAEGKTQCEALSAARQQDTWRITPRSATEGSFVSLSLGADGSGASTENRARGSYLSSAATLSISVAGTACETTFTPRVDGGVDESRTVSERDPTDPALSRAYTSTGDALSFFATLESAGEPACVVVYTYTKQ